MKTKILKSRIFSLTFISMAVFIGLSASSHAYNVITTQLDPAARGSNVTNLQGFFKDNSTIYPEGLVTGYYGSMTKAAVNRFQSAYGFDQVGRVGPLTLNKINSLINSGGWSGGTNTGSGDTYAPFMYSAQVSVARNSVTFNWTVNENAVAKVYYDIRPVTINEGDVNSVGFAVVSGSAASDNLIPSTNQQVIVSGLQANTVYYYMLVSKDANGNVSVSNVNSTFTTGN